MIDLCMKKEVFINHIRGSIIEIVEADATGMQVCLKEKDKEFDPEMLGARIYNLVEKLNLKECTVVPLLEESYNLSASDMAYIAHGYALKEWKYDEFKDFPKYDCYFLASELEASKKIYNQLNNLRESIFFARSLIMKPPNLLTPKEMANLIRVKLQEYYNVKVLRQDEIESLGLRLLVGVSRGGQEPCVVWIQRGSNPKYVFVGKGVTFDSGGISIKPSLNMHEMSADMSGAAVIAGLFHNIKDIPGSFAAILMLSENMVGPMAQKPGDIVRSFDDKKSVHVLNTDAEGRLMLADGVALAGYLKIPNVITVATLTGAMKVALGSEYAGLFSNNDELANKLMSCNGDIEKVWRLPLDHAYLEYLKSDVADIANIGKPGCGAGSIIGAKFIEFFTREGTNYAHLDIANVTGTSKLSSNPHEAWGIKFLSKFVANHVSNKNIKEEKEESSDCISKMLEKIDNRVK
jgi:leucyl aminopeptidase